MDPPSLEEFSWFYTMKSSKGDLGFYYFAKRATKEVQAITKIKESLGNWKDMYFFTPEAGVWGRFGTLSKLSVVFFLEHINARPANPLIWHLGFFVVHRLRPRLDAESLTRYLRISNLPEIERTWARLHTPGMLKKVGLLPQVTVQSVKAPIELGEHFMLQIRIFWPF